MNEPQLLAESNILSKIHVLRSQKVMLDEDLAELYGVETKRLNPDDAIEIFNCINV